MFLIKYWRSILTAIVISSVLGYGWYSSAKIARLLNENAGLETTVEASRKALEELDKDRARVDTILTQSRAREQQRKAESDVLQRQLKEIMEKANDKAATCYNTSLDSDTNQLLQEQSRKGN